MQVAGGDEAPQEEAEQPDETCPYPAAEGGSPRAAGTGAGPVLPESEQPRGLAGSSLEQRAGAPARQRARRTQGVSTPRGPGSAAR